MLSDLLRGLTPNRKKKLSESHYIVKKIIGDFGFPYEKIDAWRND